MYPAVQDSYGTFLKSTPVQIPILLLSKKQGGGGTCMNICRGFIGCVEHHVYSVTSDRPLKGVGGGWGSLMTVIKGTRGTVDQPSRSASRR